MLFSLLRRRRCGQCHGKLTRLPISTRQWLAIILEELMFFGGVLIMIFANSMVIQLLGLVLFLLPLVC